MCDDAVNCHTMLADLLYQMSLLFHIQPCLQICPQCMHAAEPLPIGVLVNECWILKGKSYTHDMELRREKSKVTQSHGANVVVRLTSPFSAMTLRARVSVKAAM